MKLSAASDDHEGRESRFVTGDSFTWGSPGRRVRRGVQKVKYVEYLGRRPFFVVRSDGHLSVTTSLTSGKLPSLTVNEHSHLRSVTY